MEISLSQKERMLLEDQKKHEQICIAKYANYSKQAKDNQLKQIFYANGQVEKTHLDSINQLLNGKIPQTNPATKSKHCTNHGEPSFNR